MVWEMGFEPIKTDFKSGTVACYVIPTWRKRGRVELPRACASSGFKPDAISNWLALP